MRPSAPNPPSLEGPAGPDLAATLADLLIAHDRAAARGAPLLTDAGLAHVRRLLLAWAAAPEPGAPGRPAPLDALPHWDAAGRRLWLGGQVLKAFRQPARHQELILAAFEEEGWAAGRIDNPLPPEAGEGEEEARWRLHRTIQNLNRGLPPGTIRFHGDGTGEGVWWGFCRPPGDAPSPG